MSSRFSNMLGLTEEEAIALLDAPSDQIGDGNSRYAAAAHLINFSSSASIQALIRAVQNTDDSLDNRIVRRKSVESLGRLQSAESIPVIRSCLLEDDCYTVENAVWAIGEIGVSDSAILEDIAKLLIKPNQSYRVIIQTLAKLGYSNSVDRIRPYMKHEDGSIASAAIAAVSRLTHDSQLMSKILPFLQDSNVYTRRLCIQDLMDAKYYESISAIAKSPVSQVFRLRGIYSLVSSAIESQQLSFSQTQFELEAALLDHPNSLELVHEYDQPPSLDFLIQELFETDFGRCYLATQTLIDAYSSDAPETLIDLYREKAYDDYGANYHVIKVLGWLKYEPALEIFLEALQRSEPQFHKSRVAAAIALGELGAQDAIFALEKSVVSPAWDLQYASLLSLDKIGTISQDQSIEYNHLVRCRFWN